MGVLRARIRHYDVPPLYVPVPRVRPSIPLWHGLSHLHGCLFHLFLLGNRYVGVSLPPSLPLSPSFTSPSPLHIPPTPFPYLSSISKYNLIEVRYTQFNSRNSNSFGWSFAAWVFSYLFSASLFLSLPHLPSFVSPLFPFLTLLESSPFDARKYMILLFYLYFLALCFGTGFRSPKGCQFCI